MIELRLLDAPRWPWHDFRMTFYPMSLYVYTQVSTSTLCYSPLYMSWCAINICIQWTLFWQMMGPRYHMTQGVAEYHWERHMSSCAELCVQWDGMLDFAICTMLAKACWFRLYVVVSFAVCSIRRIHKRPGMLLWQAYNESVFCVGGGTSSENTGSMSLLNDGIASYYFNMAIPLYA